jgi:hypothetical protein
MVRRICFLGLLLPWLLLFAACSAADAPSLPASSPPADATPIAGVLPTDIGGVNVVPLAIGDEIELPEDVAVIVETGCWYCEGPTTGFVRAYRDSSGEIRSDVLLTIDALALPPRVVTDPERAGEEMPYFTGFAFADDASDMVVSICTSGFCGGLGSATPDAETALFRSRNGGVTWRRLGTLSGGFVIATIIDEGVVLGRMSERETQAGPELQLFPSGQLVEPPRGNGGWWPTSIADDELVWPTSDGRLLRSDGTEFISLADDIWDISFSSNVHADPGSGQLIASVIAERYQKPLLGYYLGTFSADGAVAGFFSVKSYPYPGAWLGPDLVLGNLEFFPGLLPDAGPDRYYGPIPVLFDLKQQVVHLIPHPFVDESFAIPNPRNRVQAVMQGPFARVDTSGSCLRVRMEPGLDAPMLDCSADGVLVRDLGEVQHGFLRAIDCSNVGRLRSPVTAPVL